jgi:hypothetical protein
MHLIPSPQGAMRVLGIVKDGLSDTERKRLVHQGRVVHQVFKAAKSINENVLLEMHVQQVLMMHLQR